MSEQVQVVVESVELVRSKDASIPAVSKNFFERVLFLQGDRNIADFCRFLGISTPVYQRWKNGSVPHAENLHVISQKCNVSMDWLLTGKEPEQDDSDMVDIFARIDQLRSTCDLSLAQLADICGVSPQNLNRWKNGGTIMPKHLKRMAEYFQVSTDYLLTGKKPMTKQLQQKQDEFEGRKRMSQEQAKWLFVNSEQYRFETYALLAFRSTQKSERHLLTLLMLQLHGAADGCEWSREYARTVFDKLIADLAASKSKGK